MLYGILFFTIENACFNNLLHTAINASFLLFPLATILSNNALQVWLYLQALKLHINSKFLSFGFPILLILDRPFILLPLCLIIGVMPVVDKGLFEKTIYFPKGKWKSFWNSITIDSEGEWITVKAPLDTIPVFERLIFEN